MSGTRGKKREEPRKAVWCSGALNLLRAGGVGVAAALVVLGVAASLICLGWLDYGRGGGTVIAACLLGGFLSGVFAVGKRKGAALVVGLGAGAVMAVLLLMLGVVLYGAQPAVGSVSSVASACLCGGGLAGVLTGKPKKRRRP